MAKTVFLTGGSGFVGSHLARRLRESGQNVRALVRKNSRRDRLESLGVELVEGDLDDLAALRRGIDGADGVFHVAGLVRAQRGGDFSRVNHFGCRNIAQAMRESAGDSSRAESLLPLVLVSSLAASGAAKKRPKNRDFADGLRYEPRHETDPLCPVSRYGKSKAEGERELAAVADQIPVTVVRPPIVFGPENRETFPLFKMVHQTPFFLIPGFWNLPFSFVEVGDLVEILIAVAERGERLTTTSLTDGTGTGVYFASHPSIVRFSDFGRMLGHAVGRKRLFPIHAPPMAVLTIGGVQEIWKRLTGHSVPLDWDKAKEALGGPWICSGDKTVSQLQFSFDRSLAEQIDATAAWYRHEGWLR